MRELCLALLIIATLPVTVVAFLAWMIAASARVGWSLGEDAHDWMVANIKKRMKPREDGP